METQELNLVLIPAINYVNSCKGCFFDKDYACIILNHYNDTIDCKGKIFVIKKED